MLDVPFKKYVERRKQNMKKIVALLLAVMMIASLSAVAVAEEKTTISWTSWALAEEKLLPVYGGSADAFMADNPDVVVDYSQTNPYAQYLDQLLVAATAGNAPDVAHIKAEWLPQFLELGVVKDIKPYISEEVLADYNPAAVEGVTKDGTMVAMPWFANTVALYYNKALLKEAGIETLPTTWDELIEDARKVSALGDDIYGLAIPNSNGVEAGEGYNILPILWAYGADYRDADGNLALNSENAVKAFECIKSLIDDKVTSTVGYSLKDLRNLFGQGKIGFYWDLEATIPTAAAASENEEEFYKNFGVMPIPGTSGYAVNHYLIVFNSVPDEKMPAVGRFLEYMSDAKVIDIFYKGGQGKMSTRASVNAAVFADVSDITAAYVEAMNNARPLPIDGHFMEAEAKFVDALTAMAQGTSAQEAADNLQEAVSEIYDD